MTIAEQLNDVIDVLSERLGVAGDYVYQALMNQVTIEIIKNSTWLVIGVALIVLTVIFCKKVFWDKDTNGDTRFSRAVDYDNFGLMFLFVGVPILLEIALLIFIFNIPALLTGLAQMIINPEYYVLQQIMEMI